MYWKSSSCLGVMCRGEYVWVCSLFHNTAGWGFNYLQDHIGPYDRKLDICIINTHIYILVYTLQ